MKNIINKIGIFICLGGLLSTGKLTAQVGTFPTPYCMPQYSQKPCNQAGASNAGGNFINDFINSFNTTGAVNNITNNNSGCNAQNLGGINNYMLWPCPMYLVVNVGQNITCNFQSGNIYAQGCAVFVDWNNDGIFQVPAERVTGTPGVPTAATFAAMNFIVPAVPAGLYRMRVRCAYATPGITIDPCNLYGYGETEDYKLYVGAGPSGGVTGTVTANSPLCTGSALNFTTAYSGTVAPTFMWNGPNSFTSTAQNPSITAVTAAAAGVYTCVLNTGCTTTTITNTVVVNAPTTPTITSNSPVCLGSQLNFTGLGGTTYTWTGPAASAFSSNLQNPNVPAVALTNAGTYTLALTNINGCKSTGTTNVIINPLPIVTVNSPTACLLTSIGLTATGGTAYAWSGPGGYTSNAQNPNIPNAQLAMSGSYTVLVTDANSCTNTAVANVGVIPLPTPAITQNGPVCFGNTLNLNATGGLGYIWSGPNAFNSVIANPSIPAVTLPANGIYTVVAAIGACTAAVTTSVTINPLPTPAITSNGPVCEGKSTIFNGTGGVTYAWSGPAAFNSNSSNPGIVVTGLPCGGTYTLTVIDANGCINSTTHALVVNPLPIVTTSGSTLCVNQTVSLGATGGSTYLWTGPNGFISNVQNPTIPNAVVANAGQYMVVVGSVAGCTNTANQNVIVNPLPVPTAFNNGPICANQVLSLSANGGVFYSWTGPQGFSSTAQNPNLPTTSSAFSGNYQVTVSDNIGCSATIITTALVNPLPMPNILSSKNNGCVPVCVTFTLSTSTALQSIDWNFGDGASLTGTNTGHCYNIAHDYSVVATVTDMNGCVNATAMMVNAYPIPVADFNYAPIKPVFNEDVTFSDASYSANVASWNWYFASTAANTSNVQSPVYAYPEAGNYAVTLVVKSDHGCSDTITKSIMVTEDFGIFVPNTFTPNGDGLNDLFFAKGYGITKFEFEVYDRWGEKLFASTDINEAWDGTMSTKGNKQIKEGIYTWRIKLTNVFGKTKELTGHVTLIK